MQRNLPTQGATASLSIFLIIFIRGLSCASLNAAEIKVDAATVQCPCSPLIYGACIEDVNHEIYGGLYDQRLYGESFEEPRSPVGIDGWSTYDGAWSPFGDGVSVGANYGAKLLREQPQFLNGSVEFELHFTSQAPDEGANAGAIVRVKNAGHGADAFDGYEINLAADGRRMTLGRHQQNYKILQTASVAVSPFQWQHVRVVLNKDRIQAYLNDNAKASIDYTDSDALPAGSMGLRTWGANVEFRKAKTVATGQELQSTFVGVDGAEVSGWWDAIETGSARANFAIDPAEPFNGNRSQRVQDTGGTGTVGVANRGLNRWGIAVKSGSTYPGRVYLRSSGLHGRVTVSLQNVDGSQTYGSQTFSDVPGGWTQFPFALTSVANDANARFAITLDAPGTLWIDQAVLLDPPGGQFHSLPVRADIADAMTAGKLSFLRYGGTAVNAPEYRWKNMVGTPDQRPPYQGNWHPDTSSGFGIVEFVEFCEQASIEPAFAINVEEAPQDMADMVEHLNGDVSTPGGSRRAANGHPKPYGVKYIEIGNEEVIWGDSAADYDHYIERFRTLATAMRKVDPQLVFINAAWWRGNNSNCERVFKALEGDAAYWDFHTGADDANAGKKVGQDLDEAQALFQRWVPGAKMKVVIFEENGAHHDLQRALGHATTLNAVRRHGDFVKIDCEANGLQPWRQNDNGWDQGHVFFTSNQVWGMPPYYAQQMAAENHQPLVVSSQVTAGQDLDVTATKSTDGESLCLHVVNLGSSEAATWLKIEGLPAINSDARTWTLSGNLNDENTLTNPTGIEPKERDIHDVSNSFRYTFPARSYTVLCLRVPAATGSLLEQNP